MSALNQIKELINKSSLPESEKADLIGLFSKAKEEDLNPILELISGDESLIGVLSKNYQDKKSDSPDWSKILKDEESYLSSVE